MLIAQPEPYKQMHGGRQLLLHVKFLKAVGQQLARMS